MGRKPSQVLKTHKQETIRKAIPNFGIERINNQFRDFPVSTVAKTLRSQMRGAWVSSLVGELDPTSAMKSKDLMCHN